MLTKENGSYIFAKKLYEIAKYMGFDGWFINQESGGSTLSAWAGFIKEFNACLLYTSDVKSPPVAK